MSSVRPWPPTWPCWKCGGKGHRNLGTQGWCEIHLGELYATFRRDVFATEEEHIALLLEHEHDRVLRPPDMRDEPTMMAWRKRLYHAVEARIVEHDEAERAWRMAVRHVAA